MVGEFTVAAIEAREPAKRPELAFLFAPRGALSRLVVVERPNRVPQVSALLPPSPAKREDAEAAIIVVVVVPEDREYSGELPVPPQGREEAEIWLVAIALSPEEREHAIVSVLCVELTYRPKEVELVVVVTALLVLRVKRTERKVVIAPGDERPGERPDGLAVVRDRPEVHAILDRAGELHFVSGIERRRRKLLHLAPAQQHNAENGSNYLFHVFLPSLKLCFVLDRFYRFLVLF